MGDVFPIASGRSSYDPDAFYVSTTDSKGHSAKQETRFPPDVLARITEYVAERDNPLRTTQDYVRNAVIHQLNRDSSKAPSTAFAAHVAEITARYTFETELAVEDNRRAMIAAAEKVARIAQSAPPAEKDRLMAQLRLQTIGMTPQGRAQIEAIVKLHER